ncbi:aminobutyraldehyde dehydrogenase [Marinactinospora thermotolerans]|uniref:Betaine-aldehyde dehydrogenase n=1 Tax=Marinactinospora thermotolerans DSM 45154 TaxID=1122192 RepID=A0A1T4NED3_9ACTN|nr:aminobutyraldehyde dehydrogenase [Marinactinospora thermotolerans]SJZ77630.1 betaine-aldehyde dehydrogenase [Marinactinospora thermotolerans DSM 45154]
MSTTLADVIGGEDVLAADGRTSSLIDPVTGEQTGTATVSGAAEVEAAMQAAATAFATWRKATPAQRQDALLAIADGLAARAEEVADVECRETGKPRAVVLGEEIPMCVDTLRFFAGAARHLEGKAAAEYLDGHTSWIRREPVGVCAQITPWNYPLMMAVWKIGPALAAGNTVVLKPAETTPGSTVLLARIAATALPAGVLNVVLGDRDTGRLIVEHPVPRLVSITGSTRAGIQVARSASTDLKRLHLELGGNAPVLVFDDADIPAAAEGIIAGAFLNAGQDCTAGNRVIAHSSIHDALVAELTARAAKQRTGLPADADADFGPLNNADQLQRVLGLLERLPAHATVHTGGHRVGEAGYFVAPTVISGLKADDEIVREEIFAPILTVQSFETEAEAVALANGVDQGLAASVWTRDHARALRMSADLDFGAVWLNGHGALASEMPHGGFKHSGYGKDLSAYSLEDYTRVKHVMSAIG